MPSYKDSIFINDHTSTKTAGEYNFEFIPARVQSGVFFYKLETGYSTNTGKMILIR